MRVMNAADIREHINEQAELKVIGSCLLYDGDFDFARTRLEPGHFWDPLSRNAWLAMCDETGPGAKPDRDLLGCILAAKQEEGQDDVSHMTLIRAISEAGAGKDRPDLNRFVRLLLERKKNAFSDFPVKLSSAAQLRTRTFEPARYIAPHIVEGATIFAGRPKIGKSWWMLAAALEVAKNEGDVLYLALEDSDRRLQDRMTKLLGYANEWPERFIYATTWPRANDGGLEAIERWIKQAESPRIIVVDVLALFRSPRGAKENSYEADFAAISSLQRIATHFRVAIVVVCHLRKSQEEADPFEKVSGTMGLSGAADTVLILDRDGQGTTLYGRGRDIEEIEQAVEFDRDTARWRVLGEATEVRRSDQRTAIIKLLLEADAPITPAEIAAATGMNDNNVRQLLLKMTKSGEVKKTEKGRYVHPDRWSPPVSPP
jgi:hypothetical protein